MSIRYQFSYWLTAKPAASTAEPDKLINAMRNEGLLFPEGYLTAKILDDKTVEAQVKESIGTFEEDTGLENAVNKIAAICPNFDIELRSINEEDHSESSVTTWTNGKNMGTAYARTIEPGELDNVTVNITLERVIAMLKKHDAG